MLFHDAQQHCVVVVASLVAAHSFGCILSLKVSTVVELHCTLPHGYAHVGISRCIGEQVCIFQVEATRNISIGY